MYDMQALRRICGFSTTVKVCSVPKKSAWHREGKSLREGCEETAWGRERRREKTRACALERIE